MIDATSLSMADRLVRTIAYTRRRHFTTGVLVMISDPADRTLLVRQRIRQRGRWGFPGGFLRNGESYEAAAVREVHEETSLEIRDPELLDAYVQPHARHVDVLMTARAATPSSNEDGDVSLGLKPRDWLEIAGARWFMLVPEDMPPLTVETQHALERVARGTRDLRI